MSMRLNMQKYEYLTPYTVLLVEQYYLNQKKEQKR